MQNPARFSDLPEYAFPRLRALLAPIPPGGPELAMSIGEPKHPFPDFVPDLIAQHSADFGVYPSNEGLPELREAIADWLVRRYGVTLDPERQILSLNGTREGLFNAGIALCPEAKSGARPVVLMPNPFYQCYAVAAAAVGAEPVFVPATEETGFLPDFDAVPRALLDRTALVYMCSPSNPQGAVADRAYWRNLLALAERHDFRVVADECYSEIYRTTDPDAAPDGALAALADMGGDPERLVVFHSLSKRSNLPGLRSGFAAGGPGAIAEMRRLRAYSGAPVPNALQRVSAAVWAEETHVAANRALYREKFDLADRILGNMPGYKSPQAGFFLWLNVGDGEAATVRLWRETGIRVLPGAYLSRPADPVLGGSHPGAQYIRVALVAAAQDVERGLLALRDCLYGSVE
ncbi:aminotransferase class I/II-fold pyridoxal phosphate-dependent enzyme [Oceanomicrobium pacificus]|uniref:Aminotransferase class I/II-fold pyridoxal phosphate-dependent enzyme n=1 Tax=Oceanomicrobium pacificus TaxID=2692916 RepID=A0A6B0TJZ4_9RHOB|nr:aminotransferase class I/II-fold pyridoxal phosphate-dependent enzyme [Oceanomicrobium pacificus]MXU64820.1 aminotransferase class I/II-fold pyridoxal phosphate-dependent enzyme [Oceanomicrobium pacificus]